MRRDEEDRKAYATYAPLVKDDGKRAMSVHLQFQLIGMDCMCPKPYPLRERDNRGRSKQDHNSECLAQRVVASEVSEGKWMLTTER